MWKAFPFLGAIFSRGGGGFFFFYFEIYLDMSPLTKISAGVHASAAKVVPNILEHGVILSYNVVKINEMILMIITLY